MRSDTGLVVVEHGKTWARRLNHSTVRRMVGRGPSATDIEDALTDLERSAGRLDDARRINALIRDAEDWRFHRDEHGQWSASGRGLRFRLDVEGVMQATRYLSGESISPALAREVAGRFVELALWEVDL